MAQRFMVLISLGLFIFLSCGKRNNETYSSNFYGTTYNIKSGDTLDTFYTHIRVKEERKNVIFRSGSLDKANIIFSKNKENRYEFTDMSEMYNISVEDTILYFNYKKTYPAGVYNAYVFKGIRQ